MSAERTDLVGENVADVEGIIVEVIEGLFFDDAWDGVREKVCGRKGEGTF